MQAAVVHAFDQPPRYQPFEAPRASDAETVVVEVLAAGLHPRVRSGAAGRHYSGAADLPFIPGVDGVGRLPDGRLVYFIAHDPARGTLAEQTLIDRRQCVPLPAAADPVIIAAALNPAMSSWLALRRRVSFAPGQRVLIVGATGNAGQLAVQIAKHLGAAQVIAAGRDARLFDLLTELGADAVVSLAGDPEQAAAAVGAAAAEVDVVLDYVWGAPAEQLMPALLMRRADRSRPLDWIQIGAMAGPRAAIPSEALRSANLRVLGSGQGALGLDTIVAELPALIQALTANQLVVNAQAVPLADVEATWNAPLPAGHRLVYTPR